MDTQTKILETFGNRVRTRVCGICIDHGKLLLVKHSNIGKKGYLWAPPGGGLTFGETVEECLTREFKEEVGLKIKIGEFMFVYEYLHRPLHAIELFFKVEIIEGFLIKGVDPELSPNNQMIEEVRFCDDNFINALPPDYFHGIISKTGSIKELSKLKGYHHSL